MDTNAAWAALTTNPDQFLKYYPVKTAGSPAPNPNGVNQAQYWLRKQVNTANGNAKPGHMGATKPRVIGPDASISSFYFDTIPLHGATHVALANVVPMVNYNSNVYGCPNLNGNVTAMNHFVLDGTGDEVMITGELSGCCFCWLPQGANLWCTHVQPRDGITGDALEIALSTTGRFGAAPGSSIGTFGRSYYSSRATVIGVRVAGNWRLYAQTSNDALKTITGAWRIHPGQMVRL